MIIRRCVASNGFGQLTFIEGTRDHHEYLEVLKEILHPLLKSLVLLIVSNIIEIMARDTVKIWILFNCLQILETPSQSPNLNVTETQSIIYEFK